VKQTVRQTLLANAANIAAPIVGAATTFVGGGGMATSAVPLSSDELLSPTAIDEEDSPQIIPIIVAGVVLAGAAIGAANAVDQAFNGERTTIQSNELQKSEMSATQHTCVWDPDQMALGNLRSATEMVNAVERANILGIEAQYEIRDLMRAHALLVLEIQAAVLEWDKRVQEHEYLRNRFHTLTNQRLREQEVTLDSYLNNPAHRILRDAAVLDAEQALDQAIQYMYLAAKATEYEFAVPMAQWSSYNGVGPFDIFTARTMTHIDKYRRYLLDVRGSFGAFAPSPKSPIVRLASDIAPDNMTFPQWLRAHLDPKTNVIKLPLQTTLNMKNALGEHIFNVDRYNERITGSTERGDIEACTPWFVGEGLQCNIKLNALPAFLKAPTIRLTQNAPGQYRMKNGELLYFSPGPAQTASREARPHLALDQTPAGLTCLVNGEPLFGRTETLSNDLYNRSVAASWTLVIDLNENVRLRENLDAITDIELLFSTISFTR
jgi:hypothetical protein